MNKINRIIVLIDFSEYSENLINFAFSISKIINAKVVFVHKISGIAPAIIDHEIKDQIIKIETKEAHINLKKLAKGRLYSNDSFYVSKKPILTILKELKNDHYHDWVFAGLKGTGALKRLFIGSTTISIIDESDLLTVAVPAQSEILLPKKLLVGVSPKKYPLNKHQLNLVLSSLKGLINELEFFTILKDDDDEVKANDQLLELQAEYQSHNPVIQLYKGNNALALLKKRVEHTENSFLALQQGSRSLADKLFRKFMINELVYSGKTPLIVLST